MASPSVLSARRVLLPDPFMMLGTAIGPGFRDSAMATPVPRGRAVLGLMSKLSNVFRGMLTEHVLLPVGARLTPLKLVCPNVPTGLPLPVSAVLRTLAGIAFRPTFPDIIIPIPRRRCPSIRELIPLGLAETIPLVPMELSNVLALLHLTPENPSSLLQVPYPTPETW